MSKDLDTEIKDQLLSIFNMDNINIVESDFLTTDTSDMVAILNEGILMNLNSYSSVFFYLYRLAHVLSHILYGDLDLQSA